MKEIFFATLGIGIFTAFPLLALYAITSLIVGLLAIFPSTIALAYKLNSILMLGRRHSKTVVLDVSKDQLEDIIIPSITAAFSDAGLTLVSTKKNEGGVLVYGRENALYGSKAKPIFFVEAAFSGRGTTINCSYYSLLPSKKTVDRLKAFISQLEIKSKFFSGSEGSTNSHEGPQNLATLSVNILDNFEFIINRSDNIFSSRADVFVAATETSTEWHIKKIEANGEVIGVNYNYDPNNDFKWNINITFKSAPEDAGNAIITVLFPERWSAGMEGANEICNIIAGRLSPFGISQTFDDFRLSFLKAAKSNNPGPLQSWWKSQSHLDDPDLISVKDAVTIIGSVYSWDWVKEIVEDGFSDLIDEDVEAVFGKKRAGAIVEYFKKLEHEQELIEIQRQQEIEFQRQMKLAGAQNNSPKMGGGAKAALSILGGFAAGSYLGKKTM